MKYTEAPSGIVSFCLMYLLKSLTMFAIAGAYFSDYCYVFSLARRKVCSEVQSSSSSIHCIEEQIQRSCRKKLKIETLDIG